MYEALRLAVLCASTLVGAVSVEAQTLACGPMSTDDVVPYSPLGDSAAFVVTQFGDVLLRPPAIVDENDVITVHVITTDEVAPFLRVRRKSPIRTVGTINIVGAERASQNEDSAKSLASAQLCDLPVHLADFASGRGEVEIFLAKPKGASIEEKLQGSFDFVVDPLYTGAFSLGPLQSAVADPSFGIVKTATDSVVTETSTGKGRVFYALMYTPFVWGKRDLEKPAKHNWERINPTIGATLQDIGNNALVGVTIDLPFGVFLSDGIHAAKVTELDPRSGAVLGEHYAGAAAPTRKRWTLRRFTGVTVDLRAALKLLRTATSTTLQ
jgi:hypothetical protein